MSARVATRLSLSLLVVACAGRPTGADRSETDTSGVETSTGDSGGSGESESGETGGDPSPCYGGEHLGLDWGELQPVVHDTEFWDQATVRELDCSVSAIEASDAWWHATLSCMSDGHALALDWSVPNDYALLGLDWQDRAVSVVGRGGYHPAGTSLEGWMVVRDERGELVWISAALRSPEPEWTAPITIEILDLDDSCVLFDDPCYPEYANAVLFDSPVDGQLRAYAGNGHMTDSFIYLGRSTTYEDNSSPFDDTCEMVFDAFYGRWDEVRVIRRD